MFSKLFGLPLYFYRNLSDYYQLWALTRRLTKALGRAPTQLEFGYASAPIFARRFGWMNLATVVADRYTEGRMTDYDIGTAKWLDENKPERNV